MREVGLFLMFEGVLQIWSDYSGKARVCDQLSPGKGSLIKGESLLCRGGGIPYLAPTLIGTFNSDTGIHLFL